MLFDEYNKRPLPTTDFRLGDCLFIKWYEDSFFLPMWLFLVSEWKCNGCSSIRSGRCIMLCSVGNGRDVCRGSWYNKAFFDFETAWGCLEFVKSECISSPSLTVDHFEVAKNFVLLSSQVDENETLLDESSDIFLVRCRDFAVVFVLLGPSIVAWVTKIFF